MGNSDQYFASFNRIYRRNRPASPAMTGPDQSRLESKERIVVQQRDYDITASPYLGDLAGLTREISED